MIWIMVGIMVGLLLLGFPLMVPLLSAALYVMLFELDFISTNRIVAQMVSGISSPVLAAVPLFILAADIMTKGRTANRLLDLVMSFFGHLRGGCRSPRPSAAPFSVRSPAPPRRRWWPSAGRCAQS